MATAQTLTALIDQVIALFNRQAMDLPDGLFDRRTQFLLNGAPFETLLGQPPADPLVLMLTRGPAGYRFMSKALQHALIQAKVERGDIVATGDADLLSTELWLSGSLRGTGEALNAVVGVTLKLGTGGAVEIAEAKVERADLDKLRAARLEP
jgi:hypothetical protein